MRTRYYKLNEQGEPVSVEIQEFLKIFASDRTLKRDAVRTQSGQDILISTVFLSIDHSFTDAGPPVLWETMVFADDAIIRQLHLLSEQDTRSFLSQVFGGLDIQKRYTSQAAALKGHEAMLRFVMVCVLRGYVY